jgi:ATP-dependent protease ClpP protease subunit
MKTLFYSSLLGIIGAALLIFYCIPKDNLVTSTDFLQPFYNKELSTNTAPIPYKIASVNYNTDENLFSFTGTVTDEMADAFAEKVLTSKSKVINVYINSNGGYIDALLSMLDIMQGSDKKFVCVAKWAASAAAMFFEFCDERYITINGSLMFHNAAGGFSGEINKVRSRLEAVEDQLATIEEPIAARLGMTIEEYRIRASNEMWLNKIKAIKQHAADGYVAKITCSKTLVEKKLRVKRVEMSFFGPIEHEVEVSACPLIGTEKSIKQEK